MDLGTFSLSLTVKNIETSLEFYEKLGFKVIDGGHVNEGFKDTDTMKWRIIENPSIKIGLFQGMFDHNILTFNSKDVLSLQEALSEKHVQLSKKAKKEDPMKSILFADPDGNQIMLDQH